MQPTDTLYGQKYWATFTLPTEAARQWKPIQWSSTCTLFVLMLIPEEFWKSGITGEFHAPCASALFEMLWFLNVFILQKYSLQLTVEYRVGRKFGCKSGILWEYHAQFHFRAQRSFSNIWKGRVHALIYAYLIFFPPVAVGLLSIQQLRLTHW